VSCVAAIDAPGLDPDRGRGRQFRWFHSSAREDGELRAVPRSGTVDEPLRALPVLAAWQTVVAGMGGNAGTQALAVTVRRPATRREERLIDRWRGVGKEVLVGLVNGMAIGAAVLLVALALRQPPTLALVVLVAVWGNLVIAGVAGAFVPTARSRLGIDPAIASSVFVTTFTDICGFSLLLGLGARRLLRAGGGYAPRKLQESRHMDIGIIGSGNIGGTLARHLTALGHQVSIANSRGPASLGALAAETGATAARVEQAARARDVVIIAVPETAVQRLPRNILAASSAIVVDTGNYYPSRDGRIAEIEDGLAESAWVARVLGVPVVKAFNNIVAPSLATRGAPAGTPGRVCLSVAGDDPRAKAVALGLVDALGFDGIDAGPLADSWRQQPGTPAYCRDLDANGLAAALAQADRGEIARYRAEADEAARPYFT
jgi:8-hydroxy-5-deazaflavin:NADPH oxidoreductase